MEEPRMLWVSLEPLKDELPLVLLVLEMQSALKKARVYVPVEEEVVYKTVSEEAYVAVAVLLALHKAEWEDLEETQTARPHLQHSLSGTLPWPSLRLRRSCQDAQPSTKADTESTAADLRLVQLESRTPGKPMSNFAKKYICWACPHIFQFEGFLHRHLKFALFALPGECV